MIGSRLHSLRPTRSPCLPLCAASSTRAVDHHLSAAAWSNVVGALPIIFLCAVHGEVSFVCRAHTLASADSDVYQAATFMTNVGSPMCSLALSAVCVLLSMMTARFRLSAGIAIASVVAARLGVYFKEAVGRPRPNCGPSTALDAVPGYSFPSGHAITITVICGSAALIGVPLMRGRRRLVLATSLAILWATVSWSRVILGVHFPSDVVAGQAIGLSFVFIVAGADRAYDYRHSTNFCEKGMLK
uniref:Phosphatidylglycerophosphatase B n=1 Tax=Rathayibacter iranicus TaxID=59737 RepID=A0A5J6SGG0_9MICO|nr:phosphatidylglycerophosphatase B [Rathayibacter iranicus]QFF92420.1 phosphatidylglycerophosphatase B [Rathayibacter iranicus]